MQKINFRKYRDHEIPELSICFLAFFLHFFWEVVHTHFYAMKDSDFDTMLYGWLHCTLRDVIITIGSFWLVSVVSQTRRWFLRLNIVNFTVFIMAGVVYTILSERLNVYIFHSWTYNEAMPVIPLLKVGLTPILQWMIIPSVVIVLLRHHRKLHHEVGKNR